MAIKLGNNAINKRYLGSTEIKKVYLGSGLIFDNTAETAFVATYQIDDFNEALTLPVDKNYRIDWGDGVRNNGW